MNEYDINRKRELEFCANDLGVSIPDYDDLDVVAAELSRLIEKMDDMNEQ